MGLMREEYLSSTYDEKLFAEIKRRTQVSVESIGIFLAVMTGDFKRLSEALPEKDQLKIILRNISPYFQINLVQVEICDSP